MGGWHFWLFPHWYIIALVVCQLLACKCECNSFAPVKDQGLKISIMYNQDECLSFSFTSPCWLQTSPSQTANTTWFSWDELELTTASQLGHSILLPCAPGRRYGRTLSSCNSVPASDFIPQTASISGNSLCSAAMQLIYCPNSTKMVRPLDLPRKQMNLIWNCF